MTILSMNAGCTDCDVLRMGAPHSVSTLVARATAAIGQAASRAGEWALEHALDAAGGMTLALVPFSLLA